MKIKGKMSSSIAQLERQLNVIRTHKNELVSFLQKLKDRVVNRDLSYSDYSKIMAEKSGGKNRTEWIHYYEYLEQTYLAQISEEKKKLILNRVASFFIIANVVVFLVILFLYYPQLTTFVVQEEEEHTNIINQSFTESGTYSWTPDPSGTLSSLRVSGFVEGAGIVRIYLGDLLVLDHKAQENGKSLISGFAVSEEDSSGGDVVFSGANISNIQEDFRNDSATNIEQDPNNKSNSEDLPLVSEPNLIFTFNDLCEETCDLSSFSLNASSYDLRIELDNAVLHIDTLTYTLSSTGSNDNEILPEELLPVEPINESFSLENISSITPLEPIRVGQSVKWKALVSSNGSSVINLPSSAEGISVFSNDEERKEIKFTNSQSTSGLVGSASIKGKSKKTIQILDSANSYELQYETPAPTSRENNISKRVKQITISGPEDPHYENVLSFASIDNDKKINSADQIRVYWLTNATRIEHAFEANDTNADGFIDTVYWITPHLSEQTFEIIVITNAEHLDNAREFISNIFNETRTLDSVWSETINNNEFVRVTFEKNLTKENDITIYPRITSGNPTIKIYEFNKSDLIAEFSNIDSEQYNKVHLSGLISEQHTFDLLVEKGSVSFDHIIDPPTLNAFTTLYLNNTASGGACPTTSMSLGTTQLNSLVKILPGEFDSTLPGTTDAGVWQPGLAVIGNTTASTELSNPGESTRTSASFQRGWLYNDNLTGYTLQIGNFTLNLTMMGGQGANTLSERIMLRASIVTCSGGNFVLVKDITADNIVGESSHNGGQSGWRASEGSRFTHPAVNAVVNVRVNVSSNDTHTFSEGQYLFVQLGFGDADGTSDRTNILHYNIPASFIVLPNITDGGEPVVSLNGPTNGTTLPNKTVTFNATFTDQFTLRNATLYVWDSGFNLINTTTRTITGTASGANVTVDLSGDGTYYWNYRAVDNASNAAMASANFTLVVAAPDLIKPNLTITFPQNNSNFSYNSNTLNVTINYTVSDNVGLFNCWWTNSSGKGNVSIDCGTNISAIWLEGINNVSISANDTSGNINVSTITFLIDTTFPLISIQAPANTSNFSTSNVTINYTISELRVNNCWWTNSSGLVNNVISCGTNISRIWGEGTHNVSIYVNDTSGNVNETSVKFVVDIRPPYFSHITNNFELTEDQSLNYDVNATDDGIGIQNYTINDSKFFVNVTGWIRNVSAIPEAIYYLNISVNDTLGNQNSSIFYVNVTAVANTAPSIILVPVLTAQDPTESGTTNILINFTAYDDQGFSDIFGSSAQVQVNRSGEITRQNLSCINVNNYSVSYANFSCSVPLWYFDGSGSWSINITINDSSQLQGINSTTTFTYNLLSAFTSGPATFTFDSLNPGSTNQTSNNDPLSLNNTGNNPISAGNIQINATDLVGETDNSKAIYAGNISIGLATGGSPPSECANATGTNVSLMNRALFVPIINGTLGKGNYSVNNGATAQEQLYVCINTVGSELSAQAYSTLNQGSWTIKILAVAVVFKRRKKKLENDRILKALDLLMDELKEKHSLDTSELMHILISELQDKYGLSRKEILNSVKKNTSKSAIFIPVSVFIKELGFLESLVVYLKEQGHKYSDIARMLNRNERTIWTAYNAARKKYTESLDVDSDDVVVPLSSLVKGDLTVLESLVVYLKEQGHKYSDIARMLNRDPRNVWTVYSRTVSKIKSKV